MKLADLLILLKTYGYVIKDIQIDATEFKTVNAVLMGEYSEYYVIRIPDEEPHEIREFLVGKYQQYLSDEVSKYKLIPSADLLEVKLKCDLSRC